MAKLRLHPQRFFMRKQLLLGFSVAIAGSMSALAQEAVYRCGHEYTNAPRDVRQCERMVTQSVTVITGTRPASPRAVGTITKEARPSSEVMRATNTQQAERDLHARTIVSHELDKARQQLTLLVQEYNDGEPVKWASESRNHQKYLDRVAALKASIERTQRDIDSLQRELDRRPVVASNRTP